MNPIEYHFEQLPFVKSGNYILQIVKNRKLSIVYHYHNFYEIILILRGNATHVINGQTFEMASGDCVILHPEHSHKFIGQSENLELLGFSITNNEFIQFYDNYKMDLSSDIAPLSNIQIFSCLSRLSEIRNLSQKCCSYTDNVFDQKLLLCTILNCYCTDMLTANSTTPLVLHNAVTKMHSIENLKKGMSAMIELTNYSRSHLCRLMKKHYQKSPHEFINKLRLETAYNMLLSSDFSIDEISENIGYSSVSHFNIIFKKEFGISPAILRKNCNTYQSF